MCMRYKIIIYIRSVLSLYAINTKSKWLKSLCSMDHVKLSFTWSSSRAQMTQGIPVLSCNRTRTDAVMLSVQVRAWMRAANSIVSLWCTHKHGWFIYLAGTSCRNTIVNVVYTCYVRLGCCFYRTWYYYNTCKLWV